MNEGLPKSESSPSPESPLSRSVLNLFNDPSKQEALQRILALPDCTVTLAPISGDKIPGKDSFSKITLSLGKGPHYTSDVEISYTDGRWTVTGMSLRDRHLGTIEAGYLTNHGFISTAEEDLQQAQENGDRENITRYETALTLMREVEKLVE